MTTKNSIPIFYFVILILIGAAGFAGSIQMSDRAVADTATKVAATAAARPTQTPAPGNHPVGAVATATADCASSDLKKAECDFKVVLQAAIDGRGTITQLRIVQKRYVEVWNNQRQPSWRPAIRIASDEELNTFVEWARKAGKFPQEGIKLSKQFCNIACEDRFYLTAPNYEAAILFDGTVLHQTFQLLAGKITTIQNCNFAVKFQDMQRAWSCPITAVIMYQTKNGANYSKNLNEFAIPTEWLNDDTNVVVEEF